MKIDTSNIENFEAMSADEKLEALLNLDLPEPVDTSNMVSKALFDKKASEAAELSKKLKAKMTDDEQAAAARDEAQHALEKLLEEAKEQIDSLTREKTIGKLTADYLAQGYEKDLAAKAAEALADGNTDKVMEYASQHMLAAEKALRAELLKGTPTPPGADGSSMSENVAKAKSFGAVRAAEDKATSDILAKYL